MTVQHSPIAGPAAVSAEMSMLVDIGSAWTKAAMVARARNRWRIVTQVAQPSAWGEDELRSALTKRMTGWVDPRVAGRIGGLHSAPRIACHTPRRVGRLGLAAVSSRSVQGQQPRAVPRSRPAGPSRRPRRRTMGAR